MAKVGKKKPSRKAMPLRTKILVTGSCIACAILIFGMPVIAWFGWRTNQAQQACSATVQEMTDALPKVPHAVIDSIAAAEAGRKAASSSPACRTAAETYSAFGATIAWWYRSAILVLVLSAVPWFYQLFRRQH